jgi:hypothetical protein
MQRGMPGTPSTAAAIAQESQAVRREPARFTREPTALKHFFGLLASRQAALSDPQLGGAPCSKAKAMSQQLPPSYLECLLSRW